MQPLHTTSLLFFVGGGRSPLYPPNKVIFWDEAQGEEIAELEFRERVRGLACRRGWLVVALRRRAVAFKFDSENGRPERWKEWDTCDNPRGKKSLIQMSSTFVWTSFTSCCRLSSLASFMVNLRLLIQYSFLQAS